MNFLRNCLLSCLLITSPYLCAMGPTQVSPAQSMEEVCNNLEHMRLEDQTPRASQEQQTAISRPNKRAIGSIAKTQLPALLHQRAINLPGAKKALHSLIAKVGPISDVTFSGLAFIASEIEQISDLENAMDVIAKRNGISPYYYRHARELARRFYPRDQFQEWERLDQERSLISDAACTRMQTIVDGFTSAEQRENWRRWRVVEILERHVQMNPTYTADHQSFTQAFERSLHDYTRFIAQIYARQEGLEPRSTETQIS